MARRPAGVFINVPFDIRYRKLFHALIFTVHECGFLARCAQESSDGSEIRMDKLYAIIGDCPFGIHDLSRVTLDTRNRLPRFNMPLELGMYLGAKRFGNARQKSKSCLILEREPYRYQIFCSDISGQDIRAHNNRVSDAIKAVREWLRAARPTTSVLGASSIAGRYLEFRRDLPHMCKSAGLDVGDLSFLDFRMFVLGWRAENAS